MTADERKRAALLEEASRLYCKTGLNKKIIIFVTVMHILFIAAMLTAKDPSILMPTFALVSIVTSMISIITTDLIGDKGGVRREASMKLGSTMTSGKLLCTMPFEAKDVLNLRLVNWERQLVEKSAMLVLIQIILMAEQAMGLEFSHEFLPASCGVLLFMLIGEAFLIADCMSKSFKRSVLCGAGYGIFMMSWFPFLDYQGYLLTLKKFWNGFFGAFYGVSGIIVTVLLTALLIAAGELAAKRKKAVSWELG